MTDRARIQNIIRNYKRQGFDISDINIDEMGDLSRVREIDIAKKAKVTPQTTKAGRLKKDYFRQVETAERYGIELSDKPEVFNYSKKNVSYVHDLRESMTEVRKYFNKHPEEARARKKATYIKSLGLAEAPNIAHQNFQHYLDTWRNPIKRTNNEYMHDTFQDEFEKLQQHYQAAIDIYGEEEVARRIQAAADELGDMMDSMYHYIGSSPEGMSNIFRNAIFNEAMTPEEEQEYWNDIEEYENEQ